MKFMLCEVCKKKLPKRWVYHPMDLTTKKVDKSRARCFDCLNADPRLEKIAVEFKDEK